LEVSLSFILHSVTNHSPQTLRYERHKAVLRHLGGDSPSSSLAQEFGVVNARIGI